MTRPGWIPRRRGTAALFAAIILLQASVPGVLAAQGGARLQPADTTWVARSGIYEVYVRDFSATGDFAGVIKGLDRVQAVGTNVLWLMPIFPVGVEHRKLPLGSPYSVSDYRGLNPAFGTAAEFRALVRAVHTRGMKLILDWVPNHTAWDNVWVKEHPDFYVRDAQGGLTVPRDDKGNLTDWTDVAQLDYRNPALRTAMIDAMRYWLDEYGIDGFRVDAAGFVPDDFWQQAVPALRQAVPRRILLLAEWGDVKMHRFGFDLTYDWTGYAGVKKVWAGAPAAAFVQTEIADTRTIPAGGMRLRFTTNHDETAWDKPPVTLFGGSAGARAAFVAMAFLPGRPLIYDGQEVESPQVLGLFVQQPIQWRQAHADADRAFYRRVVHLVRTDPALLAGGVDAVQTSLPDDVIAYRRGNIVVLVNSRERAARFTVSGASLAGARDLLSNRVQRGQEVSLAPWGAVALATRR